MYFVFIHLKDTPVKLKLQVPNILASCVTYDSIIADLSDGHTISIPLALSWRQFEASQTQRIHFELIGSVLSAQWPDIDKGIRVASMWHGTLARRP